MKFEELQEKVLEWADEKDLLHGENVDAQFMKFIEETYELKTEMDYLYISNDFFEKYAYSINVDVEMGDVFVTLIILCEQMGRDPVECLGYAYEKIKDRQGETVNGTFVKQEDL